MPPAPSNKIYIHWTSEASSLFQLKRSKFRLCVFLTIKCFTDYHAIWNQRTFGSKAGQIICVRISYFSLVSKWGPFFEPLSQLRLIDLTDSHETWNHKTSFLTEWSKVFVFGILCMCVGLSFLFKIVNLKIVFMSLPFKMAAVCESSS